MCTPLAVDPRKTRNTETPETGMLTPLARCVNLISDTYKPAMLHRQDSRLAAESMAVFQTASERNRRALRPTRATNKLMYTK